MSGDTDTDDNAVDDIADDDDRRFRIDGDEEVANRELEMEEEFGNDADNDEEGDDEGNNGGQGNIYDFALAKSEMKKISNAQVPSIPTIYGIDRACCGTKQNTEKRFLTITKYWMIFVHLREDNGSPFVGNFGLALYNPESFSPSGGLDSDFNRDRVRKFFLFLQEVGMSASQMDKAKQFINSHLRCEFKNRLLAANHQNPYLGNPRIGETVEVAGIINDVRCKKARKDMDECIDLHAEVDNYIEKKQNRLMLEMAMDVAGSSDSKVRKLNDLSKLEFAASYNSSKQNLRRGEEHYTQRLVQRFVRRIEGIGPAPGMLCVHAVTNESKRNKSGHFQYTAAARHTDPQQDTAACHGILLLYRLCICNQHIDDFFDYKMLYQVATYPSLRSGLFLPETRDQARRHYSSCWEPFYLDARVNTTKLTHQPRVQGGQDCDRKGCTATDISRMHGHQVATADQSKAGRESYMKNPPISCLVALSGGDPKQPLLHSPPWASIFPSEGLIGQIPEVQNLILQRDEAVRRFNACSSVKECRERRLYTIKGTLECMLFEIQCAFQLFASRPLDPETFVLQADKPTFYERFRHGTLRDVFNLPVFQSSDYERFRTQVFDAERDHFDFDTMLSSASPEVFQNAINEHLVPAIRMMNNTVQNGLQTIDQNHSQRLGRLEAMVMHLVSPAFGSNHGVDPVFAAVEPFARDATTRDDRSLTIGGVTSRKRAPKPLKPLEPAQSGTLKGGGPRKKRKAVKEALRLNAEEPTAVPRPRLTNSDSHCRTLADFWEVYKKRWEPLELRWGHLWRMDAPMEVEGGGIETSKGRAIWWYRRKGMYDTVLFYKQKFKEEDPGLTDATVEEKALEEADKIFCTVPAGRDGRRKIGDINDAFRKALKSLGQDIGRGRPRKKSGIRRMHNGRNNPAQDPFGLAFGQVEIADETLNMNDDDVVNETLPMPG
jgi:hypothetical protein